MESKVVDYEIAKSDVNAWLDEIRCKPRKRDSKSDEIETLIEAVQYGELILNDSREFTLKLEHPIESGDSPIEELKFKNRCSISGVRQQLKGIKDGDFQGMYLAYAAVMTGKPKGTLNKMETMDAELMRTIVGFFL